MEPSANLSDAANRSGSVQWLQPGDALACFEPPEGLHQAVAGKVQKEVRARYGFRVGALGLLIDPGTGSEVVPVSSVTPLPDAPRGFLGLVNLRGNLVPLYELHVLLGGDRRQADAGMMVLVFGQGEQAVGVVIDGYPVALNQLSQLHSVPQLPDALQAHVSAGYMQDGVVWLEFDHGAFFDEACRDYV
ncbi:MAG TPA: chemotaxis protein CheW [Sideroxyarcus sp.]|nr:chemotaxis protein CheW [Sideroxyarcus sp.]